MTEERKKQLRELTTAELREELTKMDFEGADALTTKDQIISVMKALSKNTKKADKALDDNTPMINDNVKEDEKHHSGKALAMKKHLEAQPRVPYAIPLGIGEKKGAYDTVTLNGYRLSILKGVVVSLPRQVVDVLIQAYNDTQAAGSNLLIDRDPEIADKL